MANDPIRESSWVLPDGTCAVSREWLCPDCDGYHVVALGGIRVGHLCPRTDPPDDFDSDAVEADSYGRDMGDR